MPDLAFNQNPLSKKAKAAMLLSLLFVSAFTSSWGLSENALSGHEAYVSVTAREISESNNWIMPTYNGQLRLQKTPLCYWLVAFVSKITGGVDEFTARFPSAFLGMLSVVGIVFFVNEWLGFRTAVFSAFFWVTSMGFMRYSHSARPEMALTFFVMISLMSFYSGMKTQSRKRQVIYMIIFWVSFGLGMLAKGPAPVPLIVAPVFFYFAIFREWKRLPKILPIAGLIIFVLIVIPWPAMVIAKAPESLGFWKREFFDRATGDYGSSDKPFYYYLRVIFVFMAPWVGFVPMTLSAPFYRIWERKQRTMQYLWLWFVSDIVVMTIMGGKRQHYILPAMPAMAILAGIVFEDIVFVLKAYSQKFAKQFLLYHLAFILILAIGVSFYAAQNYSELLPEAIAIAIFTFAAVIIIVVLFACHRKLSASVSIFVSLCILSMATNASFVNSMDTNNYSRQFGKEAAQKIVQGDDLVAYTEISGKFVHYFGRSVNLAKSIPDVYSRYQEGSWIIAVGQDLNELVEDGRFRQIHYWKQAEYRKGKLVDAAIFHRQNQPAGVLQ